MLCKISDIGQIAIQWHLENFLHPELDVASNSVIQPTDFLTVFSQFSVEDMFQIRLRLKAADHAHLRKTESMFL